MLKMSFFSESTHVSKEITGKIPIHYVLVDLNKLILFYMNGKVSRKKKLSCIEKYDMTYLPVSNLL